MDNKQLPTISIVLSFKNEEDNLPELLTRVRGVMNKEVNQGNISGHELILVNDASTDRSLEILSADAKINTDIRVINMSRTFGVTPCVLAGLEYSTGDLVIYMDADLQDPPEVIHDMLKAWRDNQKPDIVHTVRLSRAGESRIKLAITRLGYFVLSKTMDINIIPNAGDFKLLSRRAIDHIVRFREKRPFMRGLVHWVGFRQVNVYYHRQARFKGETKFPVISKGVIKNFLESALISFSDVPLYLVTLMGLAISFCSFLYLAYIVIEKFRGHNLPGWSAIMVTMLFIGGVQLISLGIISLYISTINLNTKDRPNYIVESTIGLDKKIR